jgi:hypothetical protein
MLEDALEGLAGRLGQGEHPLAHPLDVFALVVARAAAAGAAFSSRNICITWCFLRP